MPFIRTLLLTALTFAVCSVALADDATDIAFFEKRIRPVLIHHCYECHSAASSELKGGLRLDSRDFIRQGGESGPAIVPGNTEKSLLLDAIRHESFAMPPDKKLPDEVIKDFEKWIEIGAPDPRDQPPSAEEVSELSWKTMLSARRSWWSLQPVDSDVAKVAETFGRNSSQVSLLIDDLISAKQQAAGISPGKPASARVLARRLALVLTGLPPTSTDVEQFVNYYEKDPDAAYESLVDRLLDSPHFGEHWARHWMDVVRFAETHGYEWNHEIRDAWRYRDYLIRAFNNDVPYDQLVREHIAGDLLESPRVNEQLGINESIIGTAFWRFGELGHDDCVEFPEIRFDAIDNQIDTFAKAFQGLTISCARCHDHKLDAISTKDYYALVGMLENCSQVVHTIDSPQRIADVVVVTQRLKKELREQLGKRWLAAIEQSHDPIALAISGSRSESRQDFRQPAETETLGEFRYELEKYIADEKLDRDDPGYVLGRLARRDAGTSNESAADTGDLRQAHWLWYPEGNAATDAPIETRYFRRRIVVPEDRRVTKALCFFAGDDSVKFYVNGEHIGTGNSHPALVGVDLVRKLKAGPNELAVANTNGNPAVQPNPGGWIGVVRVEFDRGDPLLFYSDSNWKSSRTAKEGWQTDNFADADWVDAMELGKAGIPPWGFPWAKQSHVRHEVDLALLWPILRKEYTAEQDRRMRSNAENFEVWADFRAAESQRVAKVAKTFGRDDETKHAPAETLGEFRYSELGWSISGLGLSQGPSRSGEFTLTHEGDQVVAAILPAGLYTNVTSDRLNGSLRSPWVPTRKKFISVQLVGDGRSMVRPVVDSCGLNEFAGGGLEYLAGGVTTWKRLPTSAGGSHRSFVELTTKSDNPRWPDRPGRAGTNDPKELNSPRSSFGVMRAVLHDSAAPPLPELTHILRLLEVTKPGTESTRESSESRQDFRQPRESSESRQDFRQPAESSESRQDFRHPPESSESRQDFRQPADTPVETLGEFRYDEADIAESIQSVAREAVIAWKDDHASDDDVIWVNWLLKVGLLPNSVNGDQQLSGLVQEYRSLESTIPEPRVVAGLADQGTSMGFPVLQGGDPLRPSSVVPARYIEVIAGSVQPFESHGSGRRGLAEIITDPSNPLTARVMVNRVWHHLFGRGIVATPDDFGHMGELPTHPQLLDYLAADFVKDGSSIKRLIRRIVLSRTFRQSSRQEDAAVQLDPANQLLHHYPARRLSAEAIRDTILAVSGRLDTQIYGASIHPHRKMEIDYRKLWSGPLDGDGRRSLYIKVTRMEGPQFLELFDFPNPMATRGRRDRTNVPTQALALLNDPFVIDQAKFWAEQLVATDHDSIVERVQGMFRRALGRPPDKEEQQRLVALIRQLAGDASADDDAILKNKGIWQDAAHAVFNMKEVIYIR